MLGSKFNKGMTLIELMITIAILAIVAAIAVPSLSNFINSNRLTGIANNLNATLTSARAEAVKLKTDVTVAPVSGSWANGWVVSYVDGGSTVELLNEGKIAKNISLSGSSSSDSVIFDRTGYSKNNHWGASGVVFCDKNNVGRKIDVAPSGSSKVEKVEC
ncbi:GspH/FimT family pseudopilin [Kangiella japonica]|uniref:Type II secretion system protein H n=1 Tax=Kangiella japonica TaxID=647384 RepID=A0ABP3CCQ3_9GAMM